ncbi:MAG TPA: hypothetical protein VIX73_25150, partial [Kofleriaceae bacterium]
MKGRVHSTQLQFTRDGAALIVAEPDGVSLVARAGDRRWHVALAGVQAIAAFADQVWAATRTGTLVRLGLDGRRHDEHAIPIAADGALIPTAIGGAAALWTGGESAGLFDDLGRFSVVAGQFHAAIPISGRRFARYAGPRLTLPAGTEVDLARAAQIVGGSAILDGTSLALVVEHPGGRDIVVVALASGRTLGTVALPPGTVRIAAR